MKTTYGARQASAPKNMSREIHFPSMATMDKETADGRELVSSGAGVRELPRTIYAQFQNAEGHSEAVIVGALHAVEFDDDGNVEGYGWLLDDENGSKMAYYLESGAFRHNSVDLAETKVELDIVEGDDGMWEMKFLFTEWKIAATTFVGKPAFADAYAELTASAVEELRSGEPLVWAGETVINDVSAEELTAAAAVLDETVVPHADFYRPEADQPHKIIVGPRREDGRCEVYGTLGLWTDPGPRKPPRPRDNYASFNQPSVLTELGMVDTGPIFFERGHPDHPLGERDPQQAYGGIENAWADVRVSAGVHGPWISGLTRPGLTDNAIYAARASRISGHWRNYDELAAIVSVNVPRFNIPGGGLSTGVISFTTDETGRTLELVASYPGDNEPATVVPVTIEVDVDVVAHRVIELLAEQEAAEVEALRAAADERELARRLVDMALDED